MSWIVDILRMIMDSMLELVRVREEKADSKISKFSLL